MPALSLPLPLGLQLKLTLRTQMDPPGPQPAAAGGTGAAPPRPPWSRWLLGVLMPIRLSDTLCVGSPQLMYHDTGHPHPNPETEARILKAYGLSRQTVPPDHLVTAVAEDEASSSVGPSPTPTAAAVVPTAIPVPVAMHEPASVTATSAYISAARPKTPGGGGAGGVPLSGTVRRPRVLNKLPLGPLSASTDDFAALLNLGTSKRAPVKPSLATLEKTASSALYFEQYYEALARATHAPLPGGTRRRGRRGRVDASAFQFGRVIGQGAFGVVHIATERSNGRICAIKQLRKTDLLRMGQEGHVRAEKDLLSSASATSGPSWIPRLYYSFQDGDHLYFVLEYMGGGDLLTLLMGHGSLPEEAVQFYAAEMVLALHQTHRLGYIHRDVKPDNFLFSCDGHIRVADFGLATDLHWAHDSAYYEHQRRSVLKRHGVPLAKPAFGNRKRRIETVAERGWDAAGNCHSAGVANNYNNNNHPAGAGGAPATGGAAGSVSRKISLSWRKNTQTRRKLAYTICGTNSYMAPEVIRGQGYGYSADWWGLGIIVFEALYGTVPFVGSSRQAARQRILDWKNSLVFRTSGVSPLAIDFMKRLLCEPEDRLGFVPLKWRPANGDGMHYGPLGPDGVEGLMSHPWFDGIDWERLHETIPPYQPNLHAADDTRHFDEDIPNEPLAPANSTLDLRDPLLGDSMYGAEVLRIRKDLAFRGWSFVPPAPVDDDGGAMDVDDAYSDADDDEYVPTSTPLRDAATCSRLTVNASTLTVGSTGLSTTVSGTSSDPRGGHKCTASEPLSDADSMARGRFDDWNGMPPDCDDMDMDDDDDGYFDDDDFELVTEDKMQARLDAATTTTTTTPLGIPSSAAHAAAGLPESKEVYAVDHVDFEPGTLRAKARNLPPANLAVSWR